MYFDRSKCDQGGDIRVFFFISQGIPIPYSFNLAFPFMNNNAEYKALILDLRITIKLKI